MAKNLDVGLASTSICFRTLLERGVVKMRNFSQSKSGLRYANLLTPAGVAEKSKLTADFLKRKVAEYETLQAEIEVLRGEVSFSSQTSLELSKVSKSMENG